jgi:hypothetical protein
MSIVTFIIWIVSLVLLGLAASNPRPFGYVNAFAAGVFAFDLWIGLQFLIETTDPITFG